MPERKANCSPNGNITVDSDYVARIFLKDNTNYETNRGILEGSSTGRGRAET